MADPLEKRMEIESIKEYLLISKQLVSRCEGDLFLNKEALEKLQDGARGSRMWVLSGDMFFRMDRRKSINFVKDNSKNMNTRMASLKEQIKNDSQKLQDYSLKAV